MKRILFIMMILSAVMTSQTFAQRCLSGMRSVELKGGAVDGRFNGNHFWGGLTMYQYAKSSNQWMFGAEYLKKGYPYDTGVIPHVQFTGEGGYLLNVLSSANKVFFFSAGISAMAGYETNNWNNKLLPDGATLKSKDSFIYGGAVNFLVEVYLSDKMILTMNCRERILFGSNVGNFHNQLGVGLKFVIH